MNSTNKYRILEHVSGKRYKGKGTPAQKKEFVEDDDMMKMKDKNDSKKNNTDKGILKKGPLKFRFD